MHEELSNRMRSVAAFAFAVSLFLAVAAISGCGDDKSTSATQEFPDIEGAVVPETVEEGAPIDVEVWGRTPDESWTLTGFIVEGGSGDLVTITPRGHRTGSMMGRTGTFRGTAIIPAPGSGAHTVRIMGGTGPMEFPMHVFPRNPLANLIVHGPGGDGHEQLVVGADGWAVAFRMGDGRAVRAQLSAAAVDSIRDLFRVAGFLNLEDRCLGDHSIDDVLYEISYRPGTDERKIVIAEDRLAPDALKRLVEDLRSLLDRVLQGAPAPQAVVAALRVDPLSGDPGTPRSITVLLQNRSASPVTLHFPTAQIYDVAIMDMHGMNGDMGHGGMGGMGGMGGNHDPDSSHFLWNWAYRRDFPQVPTELTLQAGEADSFHVQWPGLTNEGAVADTGLYRVTAMILSQPMIPTRHAELVVGTAVPPPGPLVLTCTVRPQTGPASMAREMRLIVENPTDQPITLHFRSGQLYDFSVFDPMRMRPGPIWTWSRGREFDPDPVDRTIPPHDRLEFVEPWDCTDSEGVVVHPGWYEVSTALAMPGAPGVGRVRVGVTRR